MGGSDEPTPRTKPEETQPPLIAEPSEFKASTLTQQLHTEPNEKQVQLVQQRSSDPNRALRKRRQSSVLKGLVSSTNIEKPSIPQLKAAITVQPTPMDIVGSPRSLDLSKKLSKAPAEPACLEQPKPKLIDTHTILNLQITNQKPNHDHGATAELQIDERSLYNRSKAHH